ncbi:hypothetical protein [Streptomyces sp. NPDC002599]|uniref:hypothetical protein n=1 Tax=Streptomyces sp. NPDC002599 TaxID=3154421 RepID=UPI00332C48F7
MSANRETNHDMAATDADISFLLAEAADGVEIGTAPYQAVLRGGRLRRARRWATAAAVALVVAGSTGTLALTGGTGDDARGVRPAATSPSTPEKRHVYAPQRTVLARGTDRGKGWSVLIEVWGAPRNEAEARTQWARMGEYGDTPFGARGSHDLVGWQWVFVRTIPEGGPPTTVLATTLRKGEPYGGKYIAAKSVSLKTGGSTGPGAFLRLVIGKVASTAQEVTCTWRDGATAKALRAAPGTRLTSDVVDLIRPVAGSRVDWFVCLAPGYGDRSQAEARVTKG